MVFVTPTVYAGSAQAASPDEPMVVINEILASNGGGIEDEDGDTVPWIELYNAGDDPVDLHYYGLSDDSGRPWRWVFPDVTIDPGEFLLIFASAKERADPQQPLHTSFRISRSGEEVLLTDPQGRLIDYVPATPMPTDVSFGRRPDGSDDWFFFDEPTPGASNSTDGYQDIVYPPDFSLSGGFYTGELELELFEGEEVTVSAFRDGTSASHSGGSGMATDPDRSGTESASNQAETTSVAGGSGAASESGGNEIRYTLDGSEPDRNSRLYDGPIRITDRTPQPANLALIPTSPSEGVRRIGFEWKPPDGDVFKGTVVRARAYRPGSKPSPVETHTYFVDSRGPDRFPMPVVSITTDSLHLFDYETGIYIPGKIYDEQEGSNHLVGNYAERGREWERPAVIELFDKDGRRAHVQNIGIRVHGGASRSAPLKSLRLYARNVYGDNRFRYPIFPDQHDRDYNRLILRNSGQDFFVRSTMFRDAFIQELVRDFHFDTQAYQPAVVFINGEYWGIQNFRERYDSYYLERTHGVNPDNIDFLSDNMNVSEGDSLHYQAMLDYIRDHDPADPEHYAHIRTLMDTDNYLDYLIAQVFLRNTDWPGNNQEYWRQKAEFRIQNTEYRSQSTEYRKQNTEGRVQSTGNRVQSTGNRVQKSDSVGGVSTSHAGGFSFAGGGFSLLAGGSDRVAGESRWSPDVNDGRWRWLLIDTDAGFGLMNPYRVESYDMMRHMTMEGFDEWPFPEWSTFLIRRMLRNGEFSTGFINRSAEYLNTVFRPVHVIALIDRFEKRLEPVIEEHIRRWGQIESKDRWHYNVERMREFAEKRPKYVYEHIARYFDLAGTFDLTVDVSALHKGRVQVNRLVIDEDIRGLPESRESPYPWKGTYFRDVPVQLVARPYEGYRFSHWEGKGLEAAILEAFGDGGDAGVNGDTDADIGFSAGSSAGVNGDTDANIGFSAGGDAGVNGDTGGGASQSQTLVISPASNLSVIAVFVPDDEPSDRIPAAHVLADGDYRFEHWDADADPGTYPSNMIFQYMADADPGLRSPAEGFTTGAYNYSSRTRINGLGDNGFSFINTSNPEGNPGYPGTRLGAALLALDTREMKNVTVSWTGGTVEPNSRVYHLRLQYRINGEGRFQDVLGEKGDPVEYKRHDEAGHSRRFEKVPLPDVVRNKPYVELRWKYYDTGVHEDDESGARARLRVGDIHVTGEHILEYEGEVVDGYEVLANYPNPFNDRTMLQVILPEETQVSVTIYDSGGRLVRRVRDNIRLSAGHHSIHVDASGLASGMYIYRVETPGWIGHGKMTLIR